MNKIPVGDTISRSYGFTFSNIVSIFGIAWFPNVLLVSIAIGLVFLLAPDLLRMLMQGQFDPMLFMHVGHILGLLGLLSFIVTCMVTVGIQNKALGRHPGPVLFYFSLGAPVWRMAGTWFLAGLVIFFVGLLTSGLCVAIWFAAGSYVPKFASLIRIVSIAAACLWMIYMTVRLVFFLPAVVVAEERIGLGRGWELGAGNFWRMFVVFIAIFLPATIAFGIISNALFGSLIDFSSFHEGMDFHELVHAVFRQMRVAGPFIILFQIVERIVYLGLGNSMVADAYLGVTGHPGGIASSTPQAAA